VALRASGTAQDAPESPSHLVAPPVFENDSATFTNSGSVKLSWRSSEAVDDVADVEYELQRATTANLTDAARYYQGPDLATYISGLADGSYFFRVRELRSKRVVSDWSGTVAVNVEHHSLKLAFTLFGIGGLVFILTLLVVLRGASRTDTQADAGGHGKTGEES
jgi:hypothetical protein